MINTFQLLPQFLEEFKDQRPKISDLGLITLTRTYCRLVEGENRIEGFWEILRRVTEGCYNTQKAYCDSLKLPWHGGKAQRSAQEFYRLMWNLKWLPPGRGLWTMGTEAVVKKGGAILANCSFVTTGNINKEDPTEPFCYLMDMAMLGVGIGFDTLGQGLVRIKEPRTRESIFVVDDTREGWVELIRTTLDAYFNSEAIPKAIDYSKVRPYGTTIKTLGGTASGPAPLIQLVQDIHDILRPCINQQLTSTNIVDLFNAISRCIVAGNLRRSATLAIGDPSDQAFMSLKDPKTNAERLKKWGWSSNNAISATVGMDYTDIAEQTLINGEPGYIWLENARKYHRLIDPPHEPDMGILGVNACAEISCYNKTLCVVPEVYPANHETYEEFQRTLKYAYLYGKTVTLIPTHDPRVNTTLFKNRQLGISTSGIAQSIKKHGLRKHLNWLDRGYQYLKRLDILYSDEWLCIPRSNKLSSVKPSGSVSLISSATPGIHFPYAEYYWRLVRMDKNCELADKLKKLGYRAEETGEPNTVAIYIPVKEKNFYRSQAEVSIWEQLEIAAQHQCYWADNQISATISVKPEEAKDIKRALELYETRLKSVSFLPLVDHGYEHAPYQPISKDQFEKATKSLKPLKLSNLEDVGSQEHTYCDNDKCSIL